MSLDHIIPAIYETPDSPFAVIDGVNVQYAWDSVSLTSILSCPRRYQYNIVEGRVPNSPSFVIALVFGILVHKGIEFYHRSVAAGNDHDTAVHDAVRGLASLPETSTLPSDDDVEELADATSDDDDGITLRNSKVRTRYYLFRTVVWYLEHYKDDKLQTILLQNGEPAVELSFRVEIPSTIGKHPVLLCGHIDRAVRFNDYNYLVDYKTTKQLSRQTFEMFDLSHQMTGYFTAGNIIFHEPVKGIWIDGIGLAQGFNKFARAETKRTGGQIAEYTATVDFAVQSALHFAREQYYPMNTSACYFCEYKAVCRQPPEFRRRYLDQHFSKQPGWNPLANR